MSYDDGDDVGNGDGVLFYADGGGSPSLRLAALRRGLEDRALLEMLAACAGRARAVAIARRVVPRSLGDYGDALPGEAGAWPTDEEAWEAARREVLDGIAACMKRP